MIRWELASVGLKYSLVVQLFTFSYSMLGPTVHQCIQTVFKVKYSLTYSISHMIINCSKQTHTPLHSTPLMH